MPDPARIQEWREAVERFRQLSADHTRAGRKEDAHYAHLNAGYCEFFLRAAAGNGPPRQAELFDSPTESERQALGDREYYAWIADACGGADE